MPTFGNFQQAFSTRSVRLFQRLFIMRITHIFASRKNIFTSPSLAFSAKLIQLFSSSGGRGIGPSGRAGGNRGWMINANLSCLLLAFPTTPNKQERISNAPPPSPFLRRHPFCFFHVRGGRIWSSGWFPKVDLRMSIKCFWRWDTPNRFPKTVCPCTESLPALLGVWHRILN